jgi:CxxC motif-containing protein (DUF1111 family)
MKGTSWVWYLLAALLLVGPAGLRVLTWPRTRLQPIDPATAQAGQVLFHHEWTANDPLCNGGDGLGPVYNARSCVACHNQGGPGGGGGTEHNVTVFSIDPERPGERPRTGVVHAHAVKYPETLSQVHPGLPAISRPPLAQVVHKPNSSEPDLRLALPHGVHLSQRNTPALFGANLLDAIPERDIIAGEKAQRLRWGLAPSDTESTPVGRAARLPNGRIGRFGWKAQTASLGEFVQAACANELGLGNPAQDQPAPLSKPGYQPDGLDLTDEQCSQLTTFIASLPRPGEKLPGDVRLHSEAEEGKRVFHSMGCAECHTPDLGGVPGVYSDLLLHRMGQILEGGGTSYGESVPAPEPEKPSPDGPLPDEWRTPPLWGVADSAPYLHDGRAVTLEEAIRLHAGQAALAAQRFSDSSPRKQRQLIAFLQTLRAP